MKNKQTLSEKRLSKSEVIDYLNKRFELLDGNVRFCESEGIDYGIQIYIKGNGFVKEITCGFIFTPRFFSALEKELMKIGIDKPLSWNNIGTIFSCWINQSTCSWDK